MDKHLFHDGVDCEIAIDADDEGHGKLDFTYDSDQGASVDIGQVIDWIRKNKPGWLDAKVAVGEHSIYTEDEGDVDMEIDADGRGRLRIGYDCHQGVVTADIHRIIDWIKSNHPEWLTDPGADIEHWWRVGVECEEYTSYANISARNVKSVSDHVIVVDGVFIRFEGEISTIWRDDLSLGPEMKKREEP